MQHQHAQNRNTAPLSRQSRSNNGVYKKKQKYVVKVIRDQNADRRNCTPAAIASIVEKLVVDMPGTAADSWPQQVRL